MIKIILLMLFVNTVVVHSQDKMSGEMYNLTKIQSGIKNKRISSADVSGNNVDALKDIQPGEKRIIADIKGAGVINHIWMTISPRPDQINRNDIIIRMYWDNEDFPSVESPIGPFFGQGWNEQYNYMSYPLSAGPLKGSGLVSYFAMPFEKCAKIEIENQTDMNIRSFYFYVDYLEMKRLPEGLGRFHAWYNHELTEALSEGETESGLVGKLKENKDGKDNYVFADIKGKGHFVGINYYVHCPSPMWYGEGDDMWFIDGEEKASILGTGTEDFFNTSWCPKEHFCHPFYGYPRVNNDTGFLGRTHAYRFFINDPVYFDTAMKGTIEHGHNNNLTLDLATVSYWYQDKASKLPMSPTKEERQPKSNINLNDIHRWRHEWRVNNGSDSKLWGNEKKE